MRLYLCGPISGDVQANIATFRSASNGLRGEGHDVVSPIEIDEAQGQGAVVAGDPEYPKVLGRDVQIVADPDIEALAALPGWEQSQGAQLEVHVARALAKPVYRVVMNGSDHGFGLELLEKRTFDTGATRDVDEGKPDYEGYLSPRVMRAFGDYMLRHSVQSDGSRRASDNWQKGIPLDAYMKSAWRHFMDWWEQHRAADLDFDADALEEALCALIFNVQGYLHETLLDS